MFRRDQSASRNAFTVGHWTNTAAKTGCTVIAFDRAAPAVVDVRGGAPGTRETDVLGPGRLVQSVDAIVLSGGSAFGLGTADGVMAELRAAGRGVVTPGGPVPIVPVAVIFDLGVGKSVWPTPDNGAEAFRNCVEIGAVQRGLIGAGTGATTGRLFPSESPDRGGFGHGYVDLTGGHGVHALIVVNAAGAVVDPDTGVSVIDPTREVDRAALLDRLITPHERSSTTVAVVIVDAPVDRRALERCAVAAHDGMARAIRPCHTLFDGDIVFAAGLESGQPAGIDVLRVSIATELAIERAIRDALTQM
jgi:L-aminopeptidase/D-esterase-like protein